MSERRGSIVRVMYPFESEPRDEEWLRAVASVHGGTVSEQVLLSYPSQVNVTFRDQAAARTFVDEVGTTQRWQAWVV